jgi:ATP-dependent Clp protease ATP-binding subunit ClpC
VFERFTAESRQTVVFAQAEARMNGNQFIGTGHLLIGLVRVQDPSVDQLLMTQFGLDLDGLREQVIAILGRGDERPVAGQIPFVQEAKQAMEASLRGTLSAGDRVVHPEHLLWGLVSGDEMVSALALKRAGVPAIEVREAIQKKWSTATRRTPPAAGGPWPHLPQKLREPGLSAAPAVVPLELVLGRSERVAVLLPQLRVYANGIEWSLIFVAREDPLAVQLPLPRPANMAPPPHGQELEPPCQITIVYDDGPRAELELIGFTQQTNDRLGVKPIVTGGGNGRFDVSYFIWPLPSQRVTVTCEWPANGIDVTESIVDAVPILEAAQRSTRIWPAAD